MKRILIVDDEPNMCEALTILLESRGYAVATAADGREAVDRIRDGEIVDLIVTDLKMPHLDGIGLLEHLKENGYDIPLILITAYGTIEVAVEAMKRGAIDFITKPFNKDVFCRVIDRVFEVEYLSDENRRLNEILHRDELVCESEPMRQVARTAARVAPTPAPVLITGESGSGKGVVARVIHRLSGEEGRPFVAINCPTIPETLLESELFGYRRGAFTGADGDFKGKVRLADGGTLFLDEIADLTPALQAKLLRLLEEKQFEPLGSTTTITINTRIICATNRDLAGLVERGTFRKDLFYRINTITIDIPSLRNRQDDIIPLAHIFLARSARELKKGITGLSREAEATLIRYRWPGNVRELRNVIERAVVFAGHRQIDVADLPADMQPLGQEGWRAEGESELDAREKTTLKETLAACGGNVSAAARMLRISRSRLRYRLRKHGISAG